MGHIGLNLKTLRKHKGITQQQLAEYLGIKRPVIGAYEEERAEPRMELLKRIAAFFEVSLEDISGEIISSAWIEEQKNRNSPDTGLSANGAHSFGMEGREAGARILSITTGTDELENIEVVPARASAGYLNGHSDPEYISTLSRFRLPMLQGGTFRAFELKGDSMLPLLPGTFIIGEYVDNWALIKPGETYVIISNSEGIVYKRVKAKNRLTGQGLSESGLTLLLASDNKAYENYSILGSDILEVWKAKAYIGMQLPLPYSEPLETDTIN